MNNDIELIYDEEDLTERVHVDVVLTQVSGNINWGDILGNIEDQKDLSAKLGEIDGAIEATNVALTEESERAAAAESQLASDIGSVQDKLDEEVERATTTESALDERLTEVENTYVKYETREGEQYANRRFVSLDNYNAILGKKTDGSEVNLAMVSKWDVADFGSSTIPLNLNSLDGKVTINDLDTVATEKTVTEAVAAETERAATAEKSLTDAINAETDRATYKEEQLAENIEDLSDTIDEVKNNSIVKLDYDAESVGIVTTFGDGESETVLLENITTKQELATLGVQVDKNTSDIATNAGKIATNTANIAQNASDIATNKANIAAEITNRTEADNALSSLISENTSAIAEETSRAQGVEATLTSEIAKKQDILSAGIGITITNENEISVTDYTTISDNAAKGATALQEYEADKPNLALKSEIPTKTTDLVNDSGFLTALDIEGKADKTYVDTELGKKQATITDLDEIRAGAKLGETALQSVPSEYVTETTLASYHDSTKQNTIDDLEEIRQGAAKGATALQEYEETDPVYTREKETLALKTDLETKQDKLKAGANITIEDDGTISASGSLSEVLWGGITGTITDQEDLRDALGAKQDTLDIQLLEGAEL